MIGIVGYGFAFALNRDDCTNMEKARRLGQYTFRQVYDSSEQQLPQSFEVSSRLGSLGKSVPFSDLFAPSKNGYVLNLKVADTSSESENVDVVLMIEGVVQSAKRVLGLTNVQIAKFAGVSRPSLYNHLSGKETPKSLNGYMALSQLISRIKVEIGIEFGSGMKSFLVKGQTLQSRLKQGLFDEEEFVSAAKEVAKMMASRKLKSTKIPSTVQRAVTRSLGSLG